MKMLSVKRKIIVLIIAVMLLIYGGQRISYSQDATLAEFSDTSLAIMVRRTLGLNTQDAVDILKIPKAKLIKLTGLSAGRSLLEDLGLPVITDLTGLEHATQLRTLYLRGNKVNDITPLAQLTQLIQIDLWGNRIIDITPLTQLTQLRELDLGGPRTGNEIVDITPLAQLTQLIELNLGSNQISDITSLAQLTRLTELDLTSNQISDITPLAQLTQLTRLYLGANQISDLAPLTQLTRLTTLFLLINQIRDLTPLAQLTESLTELHLNYNQIRDVTPLAQLTYLEKLSLRNNQISDVTPLAKLSESLMELDLQSNRIRDVTPLANLIYLEELKLKDNPITDTSPLSPLLDENPDLQIDIKVSEVKNEEGDPTVTASTPYPLTAAALNGSVVTLTLSGAEFEFTRSRIGDAVTISGIADITFNWSDIERVSDTEITIKLTFAGSINEDSKLIFTLGPGAIEDYNGPALTAEIPVSATAEVTEGLVASTPFPLTKENLDGSVVTLTLGGKKYDTNWNFVSGNVTVSGIDGVTFRRHNVKRVNDVQVTIQLEFNGNIDTDSTLTFTVGAEAIADYEGPRTHSRITCHRGCYN